MNEEMILASRMSRDHLKRILELHNPALNELICSAIVDFQPKSVYVSTGSEEDFHRE